MGGIKEKVLKGELRIMVMLELHCEDFNRYEYLSLFEPTRMKIIEKFNELLKDTVGYKKIIEEINK